MQHTISLDRRWRPLLYASLFASALMQLACPALAQTRYATVGSWSINQNTEAHGCIAEVGYGGDIFLRFGLFRESSGPKWAMAIANPGWANVLRNRERVDWFLTTDAQRLQVGFVVSENKTVLLLFDAPDDLMASMAAARTVNVLDENGRSMMRSALDLKDSRAAITKLAQCVRDVPPPPPSDNTTPTPTPAPTPTSRSVAISGTGFFVAPNQLMTNNHVIRECTGPIYVRYPNQRRYEATISRHDDTNDLALLSTEMTGQAVASFRISLRVGEEVAAFGFPYPGVLPTEGNFTLGRITSLSGLNNDSRRLQISAAVQPGNSGGPLLDSSGNVIGVVVSRLERASGASVPQLANFAIKAGLATDFLSVTGITPTIRTTSAFDTSGTRRDPWPDVADEARRFTVYISCEGIEQAD